MSRESINPNTDSEFEQESRLPNEVAEFIIERVDSYEQLNAKNVPAGEKKFRQVLVRELKKRRFEENALDYGTVHDVYRLKREPRPIVFKRLKLWGGVPDLRRAPNISDQEYFDLLRDQHRLIEKYFGDEFVPHTEFVKVHTGQKENGFRSFSTDEYGNEYVIVQEEITGQEFTNINADEVTNPLNPELEKKLVEFIKRYRIMAAKEGSVIEDQIRIDFNKNAVRISDTNHPFNFKKILNDNQMLRQLQVNPDSLKNGDDIVNVLAFNFPECKTKFNNDDWMNDMAYAAFKRFGLRGQEDFYELLQAIDHFPKEGDALFIKLIISRFSLEGKV